VDTLRGEGSEPALGAKKSSQEVGDPKRPTSQKRAESPEEKKADKVRECHCKGIRYCGGGMFWEGRKGKKGEKGGQRTTCDAVARGETLPNGAGSEEAFKEETPEAGRRKGCGDRRLVRVLEMKGTVR